MSLGTQRIVIIGAGFSGTALAVQLLRQRRDSQLEVVLIERGPGFGRGVAYARRDFPHLLNVPASRMAASSEDPNSFVRFAQRHDPGVTGEDFLPRSFYGDYLGELLDQAASGATDGAQLRRVQAEAVDVSCGNGSPAVVTLADGTHLSADRVLLACGSLPPRLPRTIRCSIRPPVIRPDPWSDGRAIAGRGPLLIIGTGLTMVDVACEAIARLPEVEIHAISRHGLVPPIQTAFRPKACHDDAAVLVRSAGSTRRLVAAVRRLALELGRRGGDWREVIAHVRHLMPTLWASLSSPERRRFLRHVQAYWDIHRHRLPDGVAARLAQLRKTGQLVVRAGRVLSLDPAGDGARATWLPRGANRSSRMEAAEVVACTGPEYDVTRADDRLWRSLLARGLAVPDSLRLGVRTASGGALVNRDGAVSDRLFYLGPLLRADYWEATAVGELRDHAEALARQLSS
jgi:uncharacterized NAD(P)/FAD-binding protein YdhS